MLWLMYPGSYEIPVYDICTLNTQPYVGNNNKVVGKDIYRGSENPENGGILYPQDLV